MEHVSTEFPHTGSDGVCQRDDLENIDDLQLPGDIEEEEFCVKVEPPSDHENNVDDDDELNEIGSDPLFIPEESDDADANLPDSGVDVASKFVCTLCKPNVAVTTIVTLKRHLKNTKVHENISRADYLGNFHENATQVNVDLVTLYVHLLYLCFSKKNKMN